VRPLPVTLVTGFLGAGKTSFVKRLLTADHGLRLGVILNEFGEAGVDAVPERMRAYLELGGGCACCVANPDLVAALRELAARDDVDRLLVETSGLADPLPLSWTIARPDLADVVRLDAVVTVVDTLHHAAAARTEWEAQVRAADVLVLAKLDLATPDARTRAEAAVRTLNRAARLVPADASDAAASLLLDAEDFQPEVPAGPAPRARHSDYDAVTLTLAGTLDLDRVEDLLEALPAGVFRAKGLFRHVRGWAAFHVVAGRKTVDADTPAPAHGENRFAFFGPEVDGPALLARLQAAVIP